MDAGPTDLEVRETQRCAAKAAERPDVDVDVGGTGGDRHSAAATERRLAIDDQREARLSARPDADAGRGLAVTVDPVSREGDRAETPLPSSLEPRTPLPIVDDPSTPVPSVLTPTTPAPPEASPTPECSPRTPAPTSSLAPKIVAFSEMPRTRKTSRLLAVIRMDVVVVAVLSAPRTTSPSTPARTADRGSIAETAVAAAAPAAAARKTRRERGAFDSDMAALRRPGIGLGIAPVR